MKLLLPIALMALVAVPTAVAGPLDDIGWTDLATREPGLDGSGITLAIVEAKLSDVFWQPDPADANQSSSLFSYFSADATYPVNAADPQYPAKWEFDPGLESGHANGVANNYFDGSTGIARAPASIEAFEADYFFNSLVAPRTAIDSRIINQSFIYTGLSDADAAQIRRAYDNYAVTHQALFVNGVSNTSTQSPPEPAAMYNGIAVGRADGGGSTGPTIDGRSKPDLVAPAGTTSAATPFVAGSAALLLQAANRGDGGSGTEGDAADIRTLKALLLNGAVKPDGWAQISGEPLDRNQGAGVLNINRSHLQLSGGQHPPTATATVAAGSATTPATTTNRITSLSGWNFTTTTTIFQRVKGVIETLDSVHDYHFTVTGANNHDLTATLAWNRQLNAASINNLELRLFSYPDNTLIAESTSSVDNVEHLYSENLPAGDYVIQVVSRYTGRHSASEDYALAFAFEEVTAATSPPAAPSNLAVNPTSDTSLELSWTDNDSTEDGFRILRFNGGSGQYEEIATVAANVTTHTDTGLNPSTSYSYQVAAYNPAGQNASGTASASTYSELQNWRLVHFGTTADSGDAANTNDFDLDGLGNLVEYALGTDPASAADGPIAAPIASIESNGGSEHLTLTVNRADEEPGVTYSITVSGDLVTWSSDVTVLTDTPTQLKVRDNTPLSSATSRFIRLTVNEP